MLFRVYYIARTDSLVTGNISDLLSLLDSDKLKELQQQLGIEELLFVPGTLYCELYLISKDPEQTDTNEQEREQSLFSKLLSEVIPTLKFHHHDIQTVDGLKAASYFIRSAIGWLPDGQSHSHHGTEFRKALIFFREKGFVGIFLNRLYQRMLWLLEKIRIETDFFDHSMSVAPVTIELAGKIFGGLQKRNVLIIGANTEATSTAQALSDAGMNRIYCIAKKKQNEKQFLKVVPDTTIVSCEKNIFAAIAVDLILVFEDFCPAAIEKKNVQQLMTKHNHSPMMVIDLTANVSGSRQLKKMYNLFLFDRQDLNRIIQQNARSRRETDAKINQWIQTEIEQFYEWIESDERFHFGAMVGRSQQMQTVFELIVRIARTDITVLIQGDSGTGKELVAQAVHDESARAEKSFVIVNCGAITENLLESELFGHVRGAFTGAVSNKKGLFEEANSGTIFLDEIGELPPALQVKLLRFLQDGEIKRVGSNDMLHLNVRVIAATNRDLQEMTAQKKFRSDLFYRLNVIQIDLPSLHERTEDVPVLARYFLNKFSDRMKKTARKFTPEALQKLVSYHWPGNVRELENVVERAVALSVDSEIDIFDLPTFLKIEHTEDVDDSQKPSLKDMEKRYICETMEYCNGNYDEAARVLGIGRTTLWRKLKEYQLDG